jgi:hypothetical protein
VNGTTIANDLVLPRADGTTSSWRTAAGVWDWVVGYLDVGPNVARAHLRLDVRGEATNAWLTGDTIDGTGLYIGREQPTAFFDGATPDDTGAGYLYDFVTGTGPSTRRLKVEYP